MLASKLALLSSQSNMCASIKKHFRFKIPKTKPKENINQVEINNPNEDQQLELFPFQIWVVVGRLNTTLKNPIQAYFILPYMFLCISWFMSFAFNTCHV
jgi:hypothetical protein